MGRSAPEPASADADIGINRIGGSFVNEDVPVATDVDFDKLFRAEFTRLVAVAVGITGSLEVARDLAQETMLRAHAGWATVALVDSPQAWLRRVLTNLAIDHLRRRDVERSALDRLSRRPPPVAAPDDPASLAEMLRGLPDRQRLVVVLHYVDDLSVDEIARVLGVASGTVKTLLWKARQTIHRRVGEELRR